jgi:hypothetical protein
MVLLSSAVIVSNVVFVVAAVLTEEWRFRTDFCRFSAFVTFTFTFTFTHQELFSDCNQVYPLLIEINYIGLVNPAAAAAAAAAAQQPQNNITTQKPQLKSMVFLHTQ